MAETAEKTIVPAPKALAIKPKHPAGFLMHWLVPVKRAPARHMISGNPPGLRTLEEALKMQVGNPKQGYAPICNPNLVTNQEHLGSGEPWALLTMVNGEPTIPPSACPDCMATKEWRDAIEAIPGGHPAAQEKQPYFDKDCC